MITMQEMLDRVVAGLKAQGWMQSMTFKEAEGTPARCMYRGPGGTKCAFGHLIPDELYSEEMEGYNCDADQLEPVWKYLMGGIGEHSLGDLRLLATDLQNAHDNGGSVLTPHELRKRLRNVASKYGLEWHA